MGKVAKGSRVVAKKGRSTKPQIAPQKACTVTNKQASRKNSRIKDGWAGCFTGVKLMTGGWKCVNCDVRNKDADSNCAACETERPGEQQKRRQDDSCNGETPSIAATLPLPPAGSSNIGPGGFNFSGGTATAAGGEVPVVAGAIGSNGFTFGATVVPAPSPAEPAPAATSGFGRGGRRASKCTMLRQVSDDLDWRQIHVVGEHLGNIAGIRAGSGTGEEWNFTHLAGILRQILAEDPKARVFLSVGSTPIDFDQDRTSTVNGVRALPSINVIVIRGDNVPPEYIAIRDYQRGGEAILPFRAKSLSWQPVAERVFILKSRLRECTMKNRGERDVYSHEYVSLFTQKPSADWKMDKHGKLQVRHASFDYTPIGHRSDANSTITEEFNKEYNKLVDFLPDFLERHDLGEEHYEGVEEAIKAAFVDARSKKQEKVDMLRRKYQDPAVLEDIKVVKVYPSNSFVREEYKVKFVNQYYPKACKVV